MSPQVDPGYGAPAYALAPATQTASQQQQQTDLFEQGFAACREPKCYTVKLGGLGS